MSEKQSKWNPDKFTTQGGEFFGRVIPKAGGLAILRSSSLLGAGKVGIMAKVHEIGMRVSACTCKSPREACSNCPPPARDTSDDCQGCDARPDECSRGRICCEDCNHAALWPSVALKMTPEQSEERNRIRQARLARSVTDIANEMELAARGGRIIPSAATDGAGIWLRKTEEIRNGYADFSDDDAEAEFDLWLAKHDEELIQKTLLAVQKTLLASDE